MAEMKNVRALQDFRLKGRKVVKGEVVAKTEFQAKQDWQNLLHMPKPRVEETNDAVGAPAAAAAPAGKGGKAAGMPGA